MRTGIAGAIAMFVVAVAAPRANAQFPSAQQPEHHLIRVGFGGGASVPTSHAGDVLKTGVNGQGYLLIDPGMGFPAIRLNLGYSKFNFKDAVLGGGNAEGHSDILSGVGGLSMPLFSLGPIRPYVTAGVGAFNVKDSFEAAAAGGTVTPSDSKLRFGIDGGAGLTLKLGRLEAFAEGRVQNVYTDQGAINPKNIQSIPVTFGIIF